MLVFEGVLLYEKLAMEILVLLWKWIENPYGLSDISKKDQ